MLLSLAEAAVSDEQPTKPENEGTPAKPDGGELASSSPVTPPQSAQPSLEEWIARYGDPRDPKVDPIDWVEQIPFSETRNYVQRVLENLQVYRVRFGGGSRLLIEADLHRGAAEN